MARAGVLCAVNFEPVSAYLRAGWSPERLARRYNPGRLFQRVEVVAIGDEDWQLSEDVVVRGASPNDFFDALLSRCRAARAEALRCYEAGWTHQVALRVMGLLGIPGVLSLESTLWPRTLTLFDQVLTADAGLRDLIVERYLFRSVTFLPAPVDETLFAPGPVESPALRADDGAPRILALGSATEGQGHFGTLIRAAAPLLAGRPSARLRLVGDGFDLPEYRELIAELGLGGRVELVGRLGEAELADHLRWSEVVAVLDGSHGSDRLVARAATVGRPLIAARAHARLLGALAEAPGLTVLDERDLDRPDALAPKLSAAVEGAAGVDATALRRDGLARFGWARWEAAEREVYERVLARAAARRGAPALVARSRAIVLGSVVPYPRRVVSAWVAVKNLAGVGRALVVR